MKELLLVRHGESTYNAQGLFTGWMDPPLSPRGRAQAEEAGKLLREHGLSFRYAYCSMLNRAISSLHIIEEAMGLSWIADFKDWRLNEKHYGILQGWSKAETLEEFGEQQLRQWRRSYDCAPPPLEPGDARCARLDPRYAHVAPERLPRTESLADTVERVRQSWHETLEPVLRHGGSLLVVAHGNSLRALLMLLKGLGKEEVEQLNIPMGIPLMLEFNDELFFLRDHYLGDESEWRARVAEAGAV